MEEIQSIDAAQKKAMDTEEDGRGGEYGFEISQAQFPFLPPT
jgi:hypothetical protein